MFLALPTIGLQSLLETPPPLQREFRGVWVATVANIDWPSKPGLPTEQQQAELTKIMDKAAALNLNAVILQVRPSADALYDSKIEPWSDYLTGKQGQAPNPYWDPLAFAIDAAHQRGLELHCWFNPYRALHPAQKSPLASRHISRQDPKIVKSYGKFLWMDPGEPDTQKESLAVMMDVVNRYDIDGVHLDDYFYPYKEKNSRGQIIDFPDGASWAKYKGTGGKLEKDDWRRKNVDDFIETLYGSIKKAKPWVKFGISPFGIYRPGIPAGTSAGVDQYADLYADAQKWLANGWCDYYTPQLYWPIKQTLQSYPALLDYWMGQNLKNRHIWPGNFTSRCMSTEGNWPAQEIANQIQVTRDHGAGGNVHFSMKAFMQDSNKVATVLQKGLYSAKALVPASPWLDAKAPKKPKVNITMSGEGTWNCQFGPDGDTDVRFYVLQVKTGTKWLPPQVTSNTLLDIKTLANTAGSELAVTAIDRAGNASPPAIVPLG